MEVKLFPAEIKKVSEDSLQISWIDGFSSTILLKDLRANCPCAQCQGEEVGGRKYTLPKLEIAQPGMYEIESIEPVGNYAVNIHWKDGHDTGIYSFEYLREIMEKFASNNA